MKRSTAQDQHGSFYEMDAAFCCCLCSNQNITLCKGIKLWIVCSSPTIFWVKHFPNKRHWGTEHYVQPISVEPGLGPVKNPDDTYNVLNKVTSERGILGIKVSFAEECPLPPVPYWVWWHWLDAGYGEQWTKQQAAQGWLEAEDGWGTAEAGDMGCFPRGQHHDLRGPAETWDRARGGGRHSTVRSQGKQ